MPWKPVSNRPKQRTSDPAKQHAKNVLYGRRFKEAAARHKAINPLCVLCLKAGVIVPAFATDHIVPHKGDMQLFWDEANWQSLCMAHHNSKSATE